MAPTGNPSDGKAFKAAKNAQAGVILTAMTAGIGGAGSSTKFATEVAFEAVGVPNPKDAVDIVKNVVKSADNLVKSAENLPVLSFSKAKTPNVADNIESAIKEGAPDVLTKEGSKSQIRANRRAALKDKQGLRNEGESLDEFPFASSKEGGTGARVQSVPVKEQSVQGGVMSQFFKNNNIKDGDKFKVNVTE